MCTATCKTIRFATDTSSSSSSSLSQPLPSLRPHLVTPSAVATLAREAAAEWAMEPDDGEDHSSALLARQRRGKRAAPERPDDADLPPGPLDARGLQDWLRLFRNRLDSVQLSALRRMRKERRWRMTSHYSGAGMLDAALQFALSPDDPAEDPPDSELVHACEIMPDRRRILLRHVGPTRCKHLAGDMCRLVPVDARAALEAKLQGHRGRIRTADTREAKKSLVWELLAELVEIMRGVDLATRDWCYACNRDCDVDLRSYGHSDPTLITANSAGSTCIDHSSRGLQQGLAGPHIVPFLTWLFQRRRVQEDIIVHECTMHHPSQEVFVRLLIIRARARARASC